MKIAIEAYPGMDRKRNSGRGQEVMVAKCKRCRLGHERDIIPKSPVPTSKGFGEGGGGKRDPADLKVDMKRTSTTTPKKSPSYRIFIARREGKTVQGNVR